MHVALLRAVNLGPGSRVSMPALRGELADVVGRNPWPDRTGEPTKLTVGFLSAHQGAFALPFSPEGPTTSPAARSRSAPRSTSTMWRAATTPAVRTG